jgi:hypothetical protein
MRARTLGGAVAALLLTALPASSLCVAGRKEQDLVARLHACLPTLPRALEGLDWYRKHQPRLVVGIDAARLELEDREQPTSLVLLEVVRFRQRPADGDRPGRWRRPKRLRLELHHLVGQRCADLGVGASMKFREEFYCCDEHPNPDLRCYTFPLVPVTLVEEPRGLRSADGLAGACRMPAAGPHASAMTHW